MGGKLQPNASPLQDDRVLVILSWFLKPTLLLVIFLSLLVGCSTSEERIQSKVQALLQEGSRDANDEIVEMGEPAVEPLIAALKNPRRCRSVAYALGKIGDPRARAPLFQAFFEQSCFADPDSTRIALVALAELDHPYVVDAAVISIAEKRGGETAYKIISNAGPEAREVLIRLLEHDNSDVRKEALRGLLKGGFLDSLEPETARIVVDILISDEFWRKGINWDLADEILAKMGASAVESLADVLEQDPSNETAIRYLTEIASPDAAAALVDILENGPHTMRLEVLEALLSIAEREPAVARAALQTSLDTLIAMVTDKSDLAVQFSAAKLLASTGGPRTLEALLAGLAAYAGEDRRTVFIRLLGELGDPGAIDALIPLLSDDKIRYNVVIALAGIDHPRVVAPLVEALKDNERHIRETVAHQLNLMDDQTLEPLLETLRKRDISGVADAYLFFLIRGEPGSEGVLVEALRTYGTQEMAVDYLNSGHEPLEEAAKAWAQDNGYIITGLPGIEAPPRWHSGP